MQQKYLTLAQLQPIVDVVLRSHLADPGTGLFSATHRELAHDTVYDHHGFFPNKHLVLYVCDLAHHKLETIKANPCPWESTELDDGLSYFARKARVSPWSKK